MKLYLALSCLQTRPMQAAWDELVSLKPDGIQLTPGCVPTQGFREHVLYNGPVYCFHHGFTWEAYRKRVWSERGKLLCVEGTSVHPPKNTEMTEKNFFAAAEERPKVTFETMYPGYHLGTGQALEHAMLSQLRLAVDISHLHIQRHAGVLSDAQLRRILAYQHVVEIHVSQNEGRADSHKPVKKETYLLDWARERGQEVYVVLESYFHKLNHQQRLDQMALVRGEMYGALRTGEEDQVPAAAR